MPETKSEFSEDASSFYRFKDEEEEYRCILGDMPLCDRDLDCRKCGFAPTLHPGHSLATGTPREPPANEILDEQVKRMLKVMPDSMKWTAGMCQNWCIEHGHPYFYADFLFDKITKERLISKGLYDPTKDVD